MLSLIVAVKLEVLSGPSSDKTALTEEDMERRSKSIIDEFLHINDYKVCIILFFFNRKKGHFIYILLNCISQSRMAL